MKRQKPRYLPAGSMYQPKDGHVQTAIAVDLSDAREVVELERLIAIHDRLSLGVQWSSDGVYYHYGWGPGPGAKHRLVVYRQDTRQGREQSEDVAGSFLSR